MKHFIICICCCLLARSVSAQQSFKSVAFCETTWLVLPEKFSTNFTHSEVEVNLKKVDTLQPRWIGYFSEDTTKVAVVSTIYEKANRKQQRKGIKTSGWLFEFYYEYNATRKFSCYTQQIRRSVYYENGRMKLYSEFYGNGQVSVTGRYDNNEKQDGLWKYYDQSGRVIKKVRYKNGAVLG